MTVIDLHCHTTASDGVLSPEELVARALSDGVDVIAVTDHDTVDGVAAAQRTGAERGVRVVAGIEVSARNELQNVHVLGYFINVSSPVLDEVLRDVRGERVVRARRIVERLCELGYDLTMDEVLAQAGGDVVARPHIARAMVARGSIGSVKEAFTPELIEDGGRADVPKKTLTPAEAVRLIRAAGGAPVVAHPGVGHHEGQQQPISVELMKQLRDEGLAGLEADHPDHSPLVREELHALAKTLGLVATGGSDFHGDRGHTIGACRTSPDSLERLERRAAP